MTPVWQLGLDGRETVPGARSRPLTDRQREIVTHLRFFGPCRPLEIGSLMHAGRPTNACLETAEPPCCRYASSDGYDALRRLETRGLVERVQRGWWVIVQAEEDW